MLYNYIPKQLPGPGTQNFAFVPSFSLPGYTLPGPGTPYSFAWNALQPQQVYYTQSQYLIGLAGIVAGQMAHQDLLDTRGVTG